ncbi:MAG: histidinol-phosphatase HisJ family protein [Clostridia bacterium]|nr:histidinol-phosphatase HisJ family protein [Clostridia bacterium]
MQLFNSHVHTSTSPDCTAPIEDICLAAFGAGFSGIAITDHCSGSHYISYNSYDILKNSLRDVRRLAKEYQGKMEVLAGVEFEEIIWSPEYINRLIATSRFDVVLASVHKVQNVPDTRYFSRIDFSTYTNDELSYYINCYFKDVLKTVKTCDFDVLSHLTIILRYVCGKYKIDFNLSEFMPIIDEILAVLIERDKALEINTSEFSTVGLMPDEKILSMYRTLGGRKITIGTDAHFPQDISKGFDFAIDVLRKIGFDSYYYYKNRLPQKIII